ncbi:MAG: cyclase family protein, partial [Eubacteriaceae bacterium]|nr:cyclase family protein [Eubacteriaceae bacterium]
MYIIDITREMLSSLVYPGSNTPKLEQIKSISDGDMYNLSCFTSDVHCSTHADAPLHFFSGSCDIASMPLEHYIGDCYVIDVKKGMLMDDYLMPKIPSDAKRILLKTNGKSYLSDACAKAIADRGIITIGTDALSVASYDNEYNIHTILLGQEIAIIESLDLS